MSMNKAGNKQAIFTTKCSAHGREANYPTEVHSIMSADFSKQLDFVMGSIDIGLGTDCC
jgi:hypothetical protein